MAHRYVLMGLWRVRAPSPPGVAVWLRTRPQEAEEPHSILSCSKLDRERLWRVDAAWRDGKVLHNHGYAGRPATELQVVLPPSLGKVLDGLVAERLSS